MKKFLFTNKTFNFNQLIILFYTIYLYSGFSFDGINYVTMFFLIIIFSLLFINSPSVFIHFIYKNSSLLLFVIFIFITTYLGSNFFNSLKYTIFYFLAIFPPIIFSYFKFSKTFIHLILIYFFFLNLIIIFNYINTPGLARLMASFPERYYFQFIGSGYPYSFFLVLLTITLINKAAFFNNKFLFYCFLISNFLVIYFTYSTITTLVLLFSIITFLIIRLVRINRNSRFFSISQSYLIYFLLYLLFFSFLIFIFYLIFGSIFLSLLEDLSSSSIFWTRVYELFLFISNSSSSLNETSIAIRLELIIYTFNTTINNLIFGVSYKYGLIFDYAFEFGIGSHNEWIDNFANFGLIFGFILNSFLFLNLYQKENFIFLKDKLLYFITLFLLGLLNPIFSIQFVYGNIFINSLIMNDLKK